MPAREHIIVIIILILLGSVIYSTSLGVPFVFDDEDNIAVDTTVRIRNLSLDAISKAAFAGLNGDRPLAKLSFGLNYYFGGYEVRGYHLVNITIHILTAILLYWFALLTLATPAMAADSTSRANGATVAALGAILWLVHPIQIQAVTYIVQRMTSLAALFYLLAFICYVKARQASSRRSRLLLFLATPLAWGLSMAAKPIGITMPAFIILYEWFFFQNLDRRWLRKNIPLFALAMLFLVVIIPVFIGPDPIATIEAGYAKRHFSMAERILTELRVVVFYLSLLLLPMAGRLNLEHHFAVSHSLTDPPSTIIALAFLIILTLISIVTARKYRFLSFALLWFLGGLLLESSFISLELVFEHRLYLPSMLIFMLLPLGLAKLVRRRDLLCPILALPIILWSLITYNRNITWQDIHTLQQDFLAKSPEKPRVLNNLGNLYLSEDRFAESEPLLTKAVRLDPRYIDALYNLGNLMQRTGRDNQAIHYYETALSIYRKHIGALNNLGIIYARRGEFPKARKYFQETLNFAPGHEVALTNLGMVFDDLKMFDEAIVQFQKAAAVAENPEIINHYIQRTMRKKAALPGR